MASNVVFNGVTYSIPAVGDSGWGTDLTAYFISIASNSLQKTAGNFTITSELNLGNTFGVKAPYLRSTNTNPAVTGNLRLSNTDPIAWRKADNTGDITLLVDGTNSLIFNGTSLSVGGTPVQPAITVSDTSTIDLDLNVSNNLSAEIIANSITNSMINSAAAIAYSKLNLAGSIVNADVNASAAITYSKLNLTGGITNADINASAAISYLKLNLTSGITNSDISSGAAIAMGKLTPLANNMALQTSGIGAVSVSAVTSTELGYLSGVTSSVQTQLGAKMTNPMTTGGDVIYGGASGLPTRLPNGTSGQFLKSNGTTVAPSWGNPTIALTLPTVQRFTAGSGTYTTPAGCLYIIVSVQGGGGGGGGSGSGATAGTTGGTSSFGTSLLTAGGGNGSGGSPGSPTINAPAIAMIAVTGAFGGGPVPLINMCGGVGGASYNGGNGNPAGGGGPNNGGSAANNSGSGGAGASVGAGSPAPGAGGCAGGFLKALINSPAATYAYVVGANGSGGSPGSSGASGGTGSAGFITVEEYYQ